MARIAGIVLLVVGGACALAGVGSLLTTMSSESMQGAQLFWLAFVALPLLTVGGWCLQARAVRACSGCGAAEEAGAHFCSNCGTALG